MAAEQKLRGLLKAAGTALRTSGIIDKSCLVGIVQYDHAKQTNRYICLWPDCEQELSDHPYYGDHDKVFWRSKLDKLCSDLSDLPVPADILDAHKAWFSNLGERRSIMLSRISAALKQVVFHRPLTTRLYEQALACGRRYAYETFRAGDPIHQSNYRNRISAEREAGHSGHWNYGVALEGFFLCVWTHAHYAVYFGRYSGSIYGIAAACLSEAKAEQMFVLDRVAKKHGFGGPFTTARRAPPPRNRLRDLAMSFFDPQNNRIVYGTQTDHRPAVDNIRATVSSPEAPLAEFVQKLKAKGFALKSVTPVPDYVVLEAWTEAVAQHGGAV